MLKKILVWSLPMVLAATAALAQSADDSKDLKQLQKQATRLDNEANQGQEQGAVFDSLSKQLNVPVTTLQTEQKSTNFGFGQLFIANSLATASGKTFDQISQEFKSGKGWGEIAKENNLKLGRVVSDLKRANAQVEKDRADRAQGGGAAAAASQNRQGPPSSHGAAGPAGGRGHH